MRSPAAINLVLLAGGVSMFGGAAIVAHKRQHDLDCQTMRNQAVPDIHHACSPDPAQASTGSGGYSHSYRHRGYDLFDMALPGDSRSGYGRTYGTGWSAASYDASARPSVTRGGFGLFGGRFSLHGFGG